MALTKTWKYLAILKLLRAKDEKCEIGFVHFSKLVISIKKLNKAGGGPVWYLYSTKVSFELSLKFRNKDINDIINCVVSILSE